MKRKEKKKINNNNNNNCDLKIIKLFIKLKRNIKEEFRNIYPFKKEIAEEEKEEENCNKVLIFDNLKRIKMFKFPFKRHNKHKSQRDYDEKFTPAASLSNDGFVFIRCKHNTVCNDNNNDYITNYNSINNNNNNNNNNSLNNDLSKAIKTNTSSSSIIRHITANSRCHHMHHDHYDHYDHRHHHDQSQCSYSNNNMRTTQNSWRPQLPLPKENSTAYNDSIQRFYNDKYNEHEEAEELNKIDIMQKSHEVRDKKNNKKCNSLKTSGGGGSTTSTKKWSFGRLFRRKKECDVRNNDSTTDDDDNDRNAGFTPSGKYLRYKGHKKNKRNVQQHQDYHYKVNDLNVDESTYINNSQLSDMTTVNRNNEDNELFLPVEIMPTLRSKEHFYTQNQNTEGQLQQNPSATVQNFPKRVSQTPNNLHIVEQNAMDCHPIHDFHIQNGSKRINSTENVRSLSNDGEAISINSANNLKYRSDESLPGGSSCHSQSRRSRAARNERYLKRLSRDSESSHGQAPVQYVYQPTQRWKTQPAGLSVYQPIKPISFVSSTKTPQLHNTNDSPQFIEPYVQWNQLQHKRIPKNHHLHNAVNENKRSISCDNEIHLKNNYRNDNQQVNILLQQSPPPPPPRDPLRRVHLNGSANQNTSYADLRPLSYAFDQMGLPIRSSHTKLNARCASDDKIWAQPQSYYQSIQSLNRPVQMSSQSQYYNSFSNKGRQNDIVNTSDYRYVADSLPRSRKPIHMMEQDQSLTREQLNDIPPPSSGILRTTKSGLPESAIDKIKATQFWKGLDEKVAQKIQESSLSNRGRNVKHSIANEVKKPRSISSSRVLEMNSHSPPIYSEVHKPKCKFSQDAVISQQTNDEVDNVVVGTLSIKTSEQNQNSKTKRNSLGSHYQKRSGSDIDSSRDNAQTNCKQHLNQGKGDNGHMDESTLSITQIVLPRKKPTNLEDAITELEAIYHSLGLNNKNEETKSTLPSPKDFEQYALSHADEYDDEDSPAGEPDPIKDDVAYRNIKLANLQHKIIEKQPPFGIPLRPTIPATNSDYLKVATVKVDSCCYQPIRTISPDIIKDDLAVRTLRKETPTTVRFLRDTFSKYSHDSFNKKKRAMRTQSANIYALMRDASKPSGGSDAMCYSDFNCMHYHDRSDSLSNMNQNNSNSNDIPNTLKLLQSLREQEHCNESLKSKKVCVPFRHPSQGGAICQLPEVLSPTLKDNKTKPTPLPRKSITPEPQLTENPRPSSRMEEALNKIAQDAQESSIKLSHDLQELRREALISVPKAKLLIPTKDEDVLEMKLNEIEKVSKAAKQCSEMLLNTLPDRLNRDGREISEFTNLKNGCHEDKLIKAIDEVSEAANKVCEKILKDIRPKDESNMLSKDNKTQMDNIDELAKRCLRPFTDLSGNHCDYNKILNEQNTSTTSMSACNLETNEAKSQNHVKDLSPSNLTESCYYPKAETKAEDVRIMFKENTVIDEIDQIMKECEEEILGKTITLRPSPEGRASQVNISEISKAAPSTHTRNSMYSDTSRGLSSSSSSNHRISSSIITPYQPYSSNGYLESPSSELQALNSTDPIKTTSTTTYDVQSTTSNATNFSISAIGTSPSLSSSSPINLENLQKCSIDMVMDDNNRKMCTNMTNCRRSSSPSQYNSADELAKIFGHDEVETKLTKNSGNEGTHTSLTDLLENVSTTTKECPACVIQSSTLSINKSATIQPAILNELCLPCCSSTVLTKLHTKQNVVCNDPLNTSNDLSFNINTNYYTNQKIIQNPSRKLEIINTKKSDLLNAEYIDKNGPTSNQIFDSSLNVLIEYQQQSYEDANDYTTQLDSSLSSFSDYVSSNPDSGNVSLADFPLLATSTLNNSTSLQVQRDYNGKYQVSSTYVTEVAIGQTMDVNNDKQEYEDLCENTEQETRKQTEIIVGINRIGENVNMILCEDDQTESRLRLKQKDIDIESLVQTSKESSPLRRLGKESVIIETPKLQLTIMEERVNYEFNITPELKPIQFIRKNTIIPERHSDMLTDINQRELEKQKEENDEKYDDAKVTGSNESTTQLEKDDSDIEMACESNSTSSSVDSKTVLNFLGEQRPIVNGLTLLEHLVVACTLNTLNNNDILTIFLIIIGVIIFNILTFR